MATDTGTGELVKRLRAAGDDGALSIGQAWNALHEAADALEEALRVMADIRDARVKSGATGFPMGLHPDPATWMENRAADYLAHGRGR